MRALKGASVRERLYPFSAFSPLSGSVIRDRGPPRRALDRPAQSSTLLRRLRRSVKRSLAVSATVQRRDGHPWLAWRFCALREAHKHQCPRSPFSLRPRKLYLVSISVYNGLRRARRPNPSQGLLWTLSLKPPDLRGVRTPRVPSNCWEQRGAGSRGKRLGLKPA